MHVPAGIFVSARTNKPGKKGEGGARGSASGVKRTFAPFPSSAPPRRAPPVASTSTAHLPHAEPYAEAEGPPTQTQAQAQVSPTYTPHGYAEANVDYHHRSLSTSPSTISGSSLDSSPLSLYNSGMSMGMSMGMGMGMGMNSIPQEYHFDNSLIPSFFPDNNNNNTHTDSQQGQGQGQGTLLPDP